MNTLFTTAANAAARTLFNAIRENPKKFWKISAQHILTMFCNGNWKTFDEMVRLITSIDYKVKLVQDGDIMSFIGPSKAKFQHDCGNCTFIDHIGEMDIYVCKSVFDTLIARCSSKPNDFISCDIRHFRGMIEKNCYISGTDDGGWQMPFREYLLSKYVTKFHLAWMIALQMQTPA
jgi:hypothetical protein